MVLSPRAGPPRMSVGEDAAKAAWLAKLDAPSWGVSSSVPLSAAGDGDGNVVPPVSPIASVAPVAEYQAKAAWLASLDSEPSWKSSGGGGSLGSASEDAAKKWLARLDSTPSWVGGVASSQVTALVDDCKQGDDQACGTLVTCEDEAKRAWLARLDSTPSWVGGGSRAEVDAALDSPSAAPSGTASAEEAKRAWLEKLDAPAWGAAKLDAPAWGQATEKIAELVTDCKQGDEEACDTLYVCEEDAKNAWLSTMQMESFRDAPTRLTPYQRRIERRTAAAKAAAHPLVQDCKAGNQKAYETLYNCEQDAKNAHLAGLDMETFRDAPARLTKPYGF